MTVKNFLSYLQNERNYSELTVQSYGNDLEEFEAFYKQLDSQLSWENIDSDIVRAWMESMMDKGHTATTVNRRLSALRSFYRFALANGLVDHNPAHAVKGPKKRKPLPQFLKEREMDELLEPALWNNIYEHVRARTILLVFYTTGIRLAELISLDDDAVDFERREIRVTGKRRKQRVIPFGQELYDTLREYIERRDEEVTRRDNALFVAFAPKENPEVLVAVIAENIGGGSKQAAPIVRAMIDDYFKYQSQPVPTELELDEFIKTMKESFEQEAPETKS